MTIIKRVGKGAARRKRPITTLEEWLEHAGPKDPVAQWWDGFSAKECAQAWLQTTGQMPPEIVALLGTHPAFGMVASWEAEPEVQLRFDKRRGPRNTDLLVEATDEHGQFDLAVEAKVREPFGETVEGALAAAETRLAKLPSSEGVARVKDLCERFLDALPLDDDVKGLRYQLLTATAGAVTHALGRGVGRTAFLIQEFVWGDETHDTYKANAKDLAAFVVRLTRGSVPEIPSRRLVEVPLPAGVLEGKSLRFFVGKASRRITPPAPVHTRRRGAP